MIMDKRKLKIDIFNDQYVLISDENEEDVRKASQMVDMLMKEIAKKSQLVDAKKVAVLAALRIASKLIDLESSLECCEIKHIELLDLIEKKGLSSSL